MDDFDVLVVAVIPLAIAVLAGILDLVTQPHLSLPRRMVWLAMILLLPVVGVAAWALVRPPRHPAVDVGPGGDPRASELVTLFERRDRGEVDDEAFRDGVARLSPRRN